MQRKTTSAIFSAVTGLVLFWYAGGSGAQPPLAVGDDADITEEGLHRIDPAFMEAAWVKPDLDLSGYTRILLMPTAVQFREVSEDPDNAITRIGKNEFAIPEDRKDWLRAQWRERVEAQFAREEVYNLYEGVDSNVLVVQGFLVDVVGRIPGESVGSTITYVSDPWSVSVVLELRDATTAELVARTIDRRHARGFLEVGVVWHQTEDLLDRWANVLSQRLGEISYLSGGQGRAVPEWAQ